MDLPWNTADVLHALSILVAAMLVIVLYHALFIVVDLRRILRRVETLTQEVESILRKPLQMTDKVVTWITHMIEAASEHHGKHKKRK